MKLKIYVLQTIFLTCLFMAISCKSLNSSKDYTALKPFKIQIEKNEEGIKLKCLQGCAWTELNFTKNNYQPQTINEFGMTDSSKEISNNTVDNLPNFSFTIARTDKGIELVGKQGTAWKELEFGLVNYKPQLIDQKGMVN